jgi:hypothetical protein
MSGSKFVAPSGEISPNDLLQHIAIQATAMMLQGWFESAKPTSEQAKTMVDAIMRALMIRQPMPF